MASTVMLHDKERIAQYFGHDRALHIYELGDLDDFFWRDTSWFALLDSPDGMPDAIALLYSGSDPPTLVALSPTSADPHLRELLHAIGPLLPPRFSVHLSPGLVDVLGPTATAHSGGRYLKMALGKTMAAEERAHLPEHDCASAIVRLDASHLPQIRRLLDVAYPENWFDDRMLATGKYLGFEQHGELFGLAGVHVYSPAYRVAALGNIAVHLAWRGKGLCRELVGCLCRDLFETVDLIGLNVNRDNAAAIACYQRLGFTIVGEFEEYSVTS